MTSGKWRGGGMENRFACIGLLLRQIVNYYNVNRTSSVLIGFAITRYNWCIKLILFFFYRFKRNSSFVNKGSINRAWIRFIVFR